MIRFAPGVQAPPNDINQASNWAGWWLLLSVADVLDPMPGAYTITSWYRSIAHNRDVGGDADSQHLVGAALDISPLTSLRLPWGVVVPEGDHLHVQVWPKGLATAFVRYYAR